MRERQRDRQRKRERKESGERRTHQLVWFMGQFTVLPISKKEKKSPPALHLKSFRSSTPRCWRFEKAITCCLLMDDRSVHRSRLTGPGCSGVSGQSATLGKLGHLSREYNTFCSVVRSMKSVQVSLSFKVRLIKHLTIRAILANSILLKD